MLSLYATFFSIQAVSAILSPYLQIMLYNHGYTPATIGILLGLYECAGILGPFIIADWSDRTGKPRLIMLVCTLCMIGAFIPLTLISQLPVLLPALCLVAFFWKALPPIQDAMAMKALEGNTWKYTKIRATGTLGYVCFSLFFQFVPVLDTTDNHSLMVWLIIGGVILAISQLFIKKDTRLVRKAIKPGILRFHRTADQSPLFDRVLIIGTVIIALNKFSLSSISNFFSLYVTESLGRGDMVGLLNAIAAGSEIFCMLLAGALMARGVKPTTLMAFSSVGMVLRLGCYILFPSLTGAIVGQLFHSVVYGFLHPAAVLFVTRHMQPENRATGMALYTSLGNGLPTVLGAALGGVLLESIGYAGMFCVYILFALASLALYAVFRRSLD